MKCPECQTENQDDRKFCYECGSRLSKICPECGRENLPRDKFCGECGHNLAQPSQPTPKELSFDEKLEKIQKYLPGGLTEKILSQRGKIEGERKQVTVMFADMVGFTPLVEKIGPEEAYSIMDQVYEILIHKVYDYEGTVNEMTGDGVMALFGAPIALEDAPQRAIRSAYAIHREMTRFSDKIKEEKGDIPPLRMRIGIHTGPVVVGSLGNDLRIEFKAVGDTVNLASRMESLAEPAATYVTEDTFKLTEGFFRYEFLGEKEVKGKHEPVKVYRVIGPSTRRTRFDVSAERGLTPLVGRERELDLLLDGLERAKQGHGQAFSVISEAGVGKSRLLYEFRKAVINEDVTFFEGKCLSYSRGVAYHPIIDIYKSVFNIRESDEDDQIRDKVKRGLKELDLDVSSALPYLLELLSVKDSGFDQIPMSPEGKKNRLIETMIQVTLKAAEVQPLILAFEDLHWIDKSSEEALKYVLESISGARILLIFTYRPEFVHTWGGRSYHNQINLNRLSNKESMAIVTYLLGTEDIDPALENLILEKTEGVPFYIEQFIQSLQDLKFIDRQDGKVFLSKDIQDLTIPSTIQDVIMARVDALPSGPKELLQAGSVIEREFPYNLIKQVIKITQEELLSHLSLLKDTELIYERGVYPNSTYVFKHALTQEVVYDSILIKKKKELHYRIADAMEKAYKDRLDEHYEALAEHFMISEDYENADEYYRLASRKAEKSISLYGAIGIEEKRVSCLERIPRNREIERKIIDARVTLGNYYVQVDRPHEAKKVVDPIVNLALEHDYKRRISQIYTIVAIYLLYVEDDYLRSKEYLEKALVIAEELNDIFSLLFVMIHLAGPLSNNCEFEKAHYYLQRALDINVATNTQWGISSLKTIITMTYCAQGNIDLARQTSREALDLAEEYGDILRKIWAYTAYGYSCYLKGYFKEAEENLLQAVNFNERINSLWWGSLANLFLGHTYLVMGEYQKSLECTDKAELVLEGTGWAPSWLNIFKITLIAAKVRNGNRDVDLEKLYGYVNENKHRVNDGRLAGLVGGILLDLEGQHISDAENWINRAIEINEQNGMMWELGRYYALYAELSKRKGDLSKAKENLNKAIEILTECGADGWVEKYEKELAELS